MASRRQRQVAELLHEEISQLLQHSLRDPRLGFVTVTDVEVSPDLRVAWVYVTVLGDDADSTLEGLHSAAGFLRYQMKQTLSLRHMPELNFKLDTSLEHGMRIDRILDSIKEDGEQHDSMDADE